MTKLRVLDLFSGIGGFSLGLERTGGFETVAFCEIEPYPRAVLAKHWPGVPCYDDVRTLTADTLRQDGIAVDVICGGFPCQDLSAAGNRAGMDGTRSGLWSEIARLVGELRPRFVIVENVAGLLSGPSEQPGGWFGRVLGDLAALGYDAEWHCIPASAIGAPHRRDRIWLIAYAQGDGWAVGWSGHQIRDDHTPGAKWVGSEFSGNGASNDARAVANPERFGCCEMVEPIIGRAEIKRATSAAAHGGIPRWWHGWGSEPDVGRVAHGVPSRVDRLKGLGNAVVPQVVETIGRAILSAELTA